MQCVFPSPICAKLHSEFLAKFVGQRRSASAAELVKKANVGGGGSNTSIISPKGKALPPRQLDWRSRGAVTPVKNQEDYGDYPSANYFAVVSAQFTPPFFSL